MLQGSVRGGSYLLVSPDLLQVVVEALIEPGGGKVSLGVVLEALLVELALEILECQGIVEDINVPVGQGGSPLGDGAGRDSRGGEEKGGGEREVCGEGENEQARIG